MKSTSAVEPPLWRRAALWLLLLGPLFFVSYGGANWLASQQAEVGYIVFDWESSIPFVAWTIIPYWIIDILYAISLFICASKMEMDNHAKRLLTAQLIAVFCFVLLPLQFSFERPEAEGIFGSLFAALYSFDQPFNQAPSLHIALLVILWMLYIRHLPDWALWPFHLLCFLIGISVLTTYQHHFIDIPTGALLGWFSIWLWPEKGAALVRDHGLEYGPRRRTLAIYYFIAGILFALFAVGIKGWALWLLWPAVSLLFVTLFYTYVGSKGFQKKSNGTINSAVKWLLFPYFLGVRINSRLWTRKDNAADHIDENIWLGRFPERSDIESNGYHTVVDMTAEFPAPNSTANWYAIPCLDLVTPSKKSLIAAVEIIERHKDQGPVLVACALGYSRSAMVVIAWLLSTNRAMSVDTAIEIVRAKRPAIVLKDSDRKVLERLL